MQAYVYICTHVPGFEYSKVGYTRRLWSRLKQLENSSASAFKWTPWKAFGLEDEKTARKLESLVKSDPALRKLRTEGKSEFFRCRPSQITDVIERMATEHQIELSCNVPVHWKSVEQIAQFCVSLPSEVLTLLSSEIREAYWLGAQDSLRALSLVHGMVVDEGEVLELARALEENRDNAEAWRKIFGQLMNSRHAQTRKLAQDAWPNAVVRQKNGKEDWEEQW